MNFPILLCYAFMHCRNDSSGMPFNSVVTAYLMGSTRSKRVSLIIFPILREKKLHELRSDEFGDSSTWVMLLSTRNCRILWVRFNNVRWSCEATIIPPARTIVSFRVLLKEYATRSLWKIVDWSSGFEARTQSRRCPSNRIAWSTWFWLLALPVFFLFTWRRRRLPLTALVEYWLKDPFWHSA